MRRPSPHNVTLLLDGWSNGNTEVPDKLVLPVDDPATSERPLPCSNEACLHLIDASRVGWQNRPGFLGISAQVMGRILVKFARSRYWAR